MEIIKPQQLADEGQAEYNRGEYLSAAKLFKVAADGYLSAGDELLAAEMANNCSVAYLKGGNAESALEVVNNTDALFASKGDILRQAMALGNKAAALEGWEKQSCGLMCCNPSHPSNCDVVSTLKLMARWGKE
jgi:hypothetical protein